MPTPIVAQPAVLTDATVNFARCEVIKAELKTCHPDPSLGRALDHAMDDLYARRAFELRGNMLHTQSSRTDHDWYDTTIDACSCDTQRGVCRHRGKLAILLVYQTLTAAATACAPITAMQPTATPRGASRRTRVVPEPVLSIEVRVRADALKAGCRTQADLESLVDFV